MKQTTVYLIRFLLFAGLISCVQAADSMQERWIYSAYVKNGMVDIGSSSAKLAVRSGPGLNFNQVDTLVSGQKVESYATSKGWIRISPSGSAVVNPEPSPAVKQAPAQPVIPGSAPVSAPVIKQASAQPVTASAVSPVLPRPIPVPVRPPVDNLILSGDFSTTALGLPTAAGDTTAELSGRWIRSVAASWEIFPYGGNLGPYVRAAASRDAGRLLYVVSDAKRSTGSYVLRFDYILTEPADVLGVKVFVSDRDITIGTDGGDFRMNSFQRPSDMITLPISASWSTYYLPVELGNGYNYIYVLFSGSGSGNTGVDNVSLSPQRR